MDKKIRLLRVLLFPLILLLATCAVNPVTGKHELMLVSETQEIEIGRRAAPSLNWTYGGEFNDPQLKAYLEPIVKEIWSHSERSNLPFRFTVQNTSVPNAFALPGYVAITRGLLAELENEAQFVAIMGHEVGHVMARHTAKRITLGTLQQLGLVVGAVALGKNNSSDLILGLGAVGSSLLLLKFDREQELQADRIGVRYMAALGYDPYEAVRAHDRLQIAVQRYLENLGRKQREDTLLDAILSTHPREEVRREEILEMIKRLPVYNIKGNGKYRDRFQKAIQNLKRLNRIYFVYDQAVMQYNRGALEKAEELVKEAIRRDSKQAPFYSLYGMINIKRNNLVRAEKDFKKALMIDRQYQPSYYGLGLVALKNRNYEKAIGYFERSLELYPQHPGSHFGMGKSYFNLLRYSEAVPYLRVFASAAPRHPEVHGMLGISYENLGDIESAIREYQLQVRIAPHTELGRYAQQRLLLLRQLYRYRR